MTQATGKLSFEDYAELDAETWAQQELPEGRCEYVDAGELKPLPSESELNDFIARYLLFVLASSGVVPLRLIAIHTCEIEVPGKPKTRFPDLVILQEEHLALTKKRLLIRLDMPAPQLVAEVVSPGDASRQRDYAAKREQYQQRGIPEYWLLNPATEIITILALKDGQYVESGQFQGSTPIQSPTFPTLPFTAEQVFAAGKEG
ncbi:MAG: Uma2 family endonuclease [Leptolyngbyaceae cyanobacterium bins.349]|nr:Uma2 family endonuclease [Leptolyngbyaceae cyanobacterium bins.349]